MELLLYGYCALLNKDVSPETGQKLSTAGARVLALTMLLMALVVFAGFNARLTSILTASSEALPINGLQDIAKVRNAEHSS
jgi:preprotein translocase subunit SecF